jgi:hypothetical protein
MLLRKRAQKSKKENKKTRHSKMKRRVFYLALLEAATLQIK